MTTDEGKIVAEVIVVTVKRALKPLVQRIAALEARPELKYCGIHTESVWYTRGSMVTRSGSLWIAEFDTCARPGLDNGGWRLIVKSGHAQ